MGQRLLYELSTTRCEAERSSRHGSADLLHHGLPCAGQAIALVAISDTVYRLARCSDDRHASIA